MSGLLRRIWREALGQAQTTTAIDFPTGPGSFGDWIAPSASPAGTSAHARLQTLLAPDRVVATSGSGDARDNHYPDTPGKFAPKPDRGGAERLENWLWHHGERNSSRGQAIVAAHAACFNPRDPAWQRPVLDRGMVVVEHVLAQGFKARAS